MNASSSQFALRPTRTWRAIEAPEARKPPDARDRPDGLLALVMLIAATVVFYLIFAT